MAGPKAALSGAWFAAGFFVAFTSAAAIDVYLLGHVERMKGPHTTFLMLAWLAPVVALVTACAYSIGAKASGSIPSGRASVLTGILVSLLFWLFPLAGRFLPDPMVIALTWVACLAGSFLAPRVIRRLGSPVQPQGVEP